MERPRVGGGWVCRRDRPKPKGHDSRGAGGSDGFACGCWLYHPRPERGVAKEPRNSHPSDQDGINLQLLFERHFRGVAYYFLRAGVPAETANDLAQETFLRAHRGWRQFRGDANRSTWLFEIAKNIYKNWIRDGRTLKKQGTEISLDQPVGETEDEPHPKMDPEDSRPLADDMLQAAQDNDKLMAAIDSLPNQQRQCVQLRLQDLKYQEIATILGISVETVKSHLFQAREALREKLRRPE